MHRVSIVKQLQVITVIMTSCTRNWIIGLLTIYTIISGIPAKPPRRIIGGTDVAPDSFRFVVTLGSSWSSSAHYCGGGIISPRHVLTAAHCIVHLTVNQFVVRSGIHNLNDETGTVSKVKSLFIHPDYVPWISGIQNLQNDIGIIELEKDLIFGGSLRKINLPTEQPDHRKFYSVAGWGRSSVHSNSRQLTLQFTSGITLLNDRECTMKGLGPQPRGKLCGYKHDATICPGDSGSPLVSGGEIVGISSASTCEVGVPHVYVNVYHYLSWVNSVINRTSRG